MRDGGYCAATRHCRKRLAGCARRVDCGPNPRPALSHRILSVNFATILTAS